MNRSKKKLEKYFRSVPIFSSIIIILILILSIRIRAEEWQDFDGYKRYSVSTDIGSHDVSPSGRFLYYTDYFINPNNYYDSGWRLNKIDFLSGKLIYRDTFPDHGNENYRYRSVRESSDGRSYCLSYTTMNYDNYNIYVNLNVRIFDCETDTIIADFPVDSMSESGSSGFPGLYSMNADYSSSDSTLAVSTTYIRKYYSKKIFPSPYVIEKMTYSSYSVAKLKTSLSGKLIPDFSNSPRVGGSIFLRRSQPDQSLVYDYHESSTYTHFDNSPYSDDRYDGSVYTSVSLLDNSTKKLKKLDANSFSTIREDSEDTHFKGYIQNMMMSADQTKFAFSKLDSNLYFGDFLTADPALDSMKVNSVVSSILLSHDGRFALAVTDRVLLLDLKYKVVLDTLSLPTYPGIFKNNPLLNRYYDDGMLRIANYGWLVGRKSTGFVKFKLPIFDSTSYTAGFYSSAYTAFCGDTLDLLAYTNRATDSIKWDLADGTTDSRVSIQKVYTTPGEYLPRFWIYWKNTWREVAARRPIKIIEKPVVSFATDKQEGTFPLTVRFENLSSGRFNGWRWGFGDDSSSAEANPTHTYLRPGSYLPRLVLTTPEGLELSSSATLTIEAKRKKVESIQLLNENAKMRGRYAWTGRMKNGNFVSKLFSPELINTEEYYLKYDEKCSSFSLVDTSKILKSYYADPTCLNSACYLREDTLICSYLNLEYTKSDLGIYMLSRLNLSNFHCDSAEVSDYFVGKFLGIFEKPDGEKLWLGSDVRNELPHFVVNYQFKDTTDWLLIDAQSRKFTIEPFVFDDKKYADAVASDLVRSIQFYSKIGNNI